MSRPCPSSAPRWWTSPAASTPATGRHHDPPPAPLPPPPEPLGTDHDHRHGRAECAPLDHDRPPPGRGLLVSIDGPGGAGKTTLVHLAADQLAQAGIAVQATAQPSPGPIGALARTGTHHFHGHALACLVAADRYHHLDTLIGPALAAGTTVLCDRYTPSSLVFQVLDGVDPDFVTDLNRHAPPPDLAVFLTCRAVELRRRLAARGSHGRFEDDPGNSTKEIGLYHQVSALYAAHGVPVLELDSTTIGAEYLATRVVAAVQALRSVPT